VDYKLGLRPLGNKKRLGFIKGSTCNASLLLFSASSSAMRYCEAFVQYALQKPPPIVIETMVAYTPKIVYEEKYAFIYPYAGVGAHPGYRRWAEEAILTCNVISSQYSFTAGEYACLPANVEFVLRWDILVPGSFDQNSPQALELLIDPPGGGFGFVYLVDSETSQQKVKIKEVTLDNP